MSAGRPCSVCTHPQRTQIETALVNNTSAGVISSNFVGIGERSVQRHYAEHMHGILSPRDETERAVLIAEVRIIQQRTIEALDLAMAYTKETKRVGGLMLAVKEARANLELIAKLTGVLDERPQQTINVLLASPEWLALRERLIAALLPHPVALEEVIDAIGEPGG